MGGKTDLTRELGEFKRRIAGAIGVSKIILFGSRAEGKSSGESDVDLIIVSGGFKQYNFMQRASLLYDYWTARTPVDFLCYTPKEFAKLSRQTSIVSHALRHGIVI